MNISGYTILVTGGASGLGAACARRIIAGDGRVVIADLNEEAGRSLAAELGSRATFVATDVTDEASVKRCIDGAASEPGRFRGAILCAGILGAERVVGKERPHDLELFTRVVRVNLIGTFNVLRLAAAAMTANEPNSDGERGVIITTASVAAFDGQIGQAAYSASKAGVSGMTLPIASELARFGIRVVSIAPGIFETPMMAALPEAALNALAEQIPFPHRLGQPDEFAALAEHIFENVMLNGTTIRLDGAVRMPAK